MIDRALNALAPKLEVGQEALYDALRSRDLSRAARIIERVARGNGGRANSGGAPGRAFGGAVQREKEADLNAPDSRGLRPIHLAAMVGMSEIVHDLLLAGVPVDAMGAEGNTALHLASFHRQDGVVAVLMRGGASPNQENVKGKTPIDLAKSEITLTLLCPLHYAAERGMLDNLVSLVAKGMSVRSLGRWGETPLHTSAACGTPDAARLLLARGADPLDKNAAGETPLDLARRYVGVRQAGAQMLDLLEGAEALAVVEKAERETAEAERLAAESGGQQAYKEGDEVFYVRNGEQHPVTVMQVHRDDEEPYYTVRVNATGRERQTDANHLVRASDHVNGTSSEIPSVKGREIGTGESDESAPLPVENFPEATHTSTSPSATTISAISTGKRLRALNAGGTNLGLSPGDAVGGERFSIESTKANDAEPAEGDWARARALFMKAAIKSEGRVAEGWGEGPVKMMDSESSSDSSRRAGTEAATAVGAIAEAFASVPVTEASEILRRTISRALPGISRGSEGGGGGGYCEDSLRSCSLGGSEDDARGSPMKVGNGSRGDSNAEGDAEGRAEEEGDRVARAVADACRDIALMGLLGGKRGKEVEAGSLGESSGGR